MSPDDPITLWMEELREGDDAAAAGLWNHFCLRLYESARRKLSPASRGVYDEEDAALSAFHSVCAGIAAGRFPALNDREGLWRLLLVITSRKVVHRHRHDQQQKRDVGRTFTDSVFARDRDDSAAAGIQNVPAREPTPEFAAAFAETCEKLFEELEESQLRDVASLRLEGYSDSEIATRLGCTRRTIQRRLEVIRRQWQRLAIPPE